MIWNFSVLELKWTLSTYRNRWNFIGPFVCLGRISECIANVVVLQQMVSGQDPKFWIGPLIFNDKQAKLDLLQRLQTTKRISIS